MLRRIGVMLTVGNINHMLGCTSQRLDSLMQGTRGQDRVFHYLPFCFAGSWIMLLTCLLRGSLLMMSTDLNRLAMEMRSAAAHYFLNVPVLLERMRSGVDRQFAEFAKATFRGNDDELFERALIIRRVQCVDQICNEIVFLQLMQVMFGFNGVAAAMHSAGLPPPASRSVPLPARRRWSHRRRARVRPPIADAA